MKQIKKIINRFRIHIDRRRNSDLYKIVSPLKHYVFNNFKRKDAFYFPELKAIYYHSPKCGGTSILKTLGEKYEIRRMNQKKAINLKKINFTFARNPYSRSVSSYIFLTPYKVFREKFGIKKGANFEEYVERICKIKDKDSNNHFKSLSEHHKINGKLIHFHFVGKMESFEEDFKKLCGILGIKPIKIKHKNKTKHKPWKDYYTSELKEKVYKRYKKDFETFGYEK